MFSRKRKANPSTTTAASAAKQTSPSSWGGSGLGSDQNDNNDGGTGYGGSTSDAKRLLAGRKKAEKACDKEDGVNTKFLKDAIKKLRAKNSSESDGDDEEEKKITSILADVFRNQIPTDWNKRSQLYNTAFELTELLSCPRYVTLLGDAEDAESVLYWLVDFGNQAEQIVKHAAATSSSGKGAGSKDKMSEDEEFASKVCTVRDEAVKCAKRYNRKPEEELTMISFSERYQSELGPMRFDTVETMDNHYFLKKIPKAPTTINTRTLFKELAAYRNALPIEYGSSCFCRAITSRLDLLRVMITGPDGSPYANGCFFFDIDLPANYPAVPPKVQFLTTGGGRIRFNPNLYPCGKVCLSLLGTWLQGPGWISGQSTLLQVLISIQSLILVPDPYFNEPGFEATRGTKQGDASSKRYNSRIREHTIDAAIKSHLSSILSKSNQYSEFEGIMIKHFLEKRSLIERELKAWAKEDTRLWRQVESVLDLFGRLAAREKEARRVASRSKQSFAFATAAEMTSSTEPIELELDDSDVEEIANLPLAAVGKSEEDAIDLCDDNVHCEETRKVTVAKGGADDVVDLT